MLLVNGEADDKGNLQDRVKAASLRYEINARSPRQGYSWRMQRVEAGIHGCVESEVPTESQAEMPLGI